MKEKSESFSFRQQFRRIQRLLDNTTDPVAEEPSEYELDEGAPLFHDDACDVPMEHEYLDSHAEGVIPSRLSPGDGYSTVAVPETPRPSPRHKPERPTPRRRPPSGPADSFEVVKRRDRVVARLLSRGVVRENHVRVAWEEWKRLRKEGMKTPLWRILTLNTEIERDRIYAEAARVYAFEEAHIREDETLAFIEGITDVFTEEQWDQMIELFVLPVAQEKEPYRGEVRWIFATHDPARPEINHMLQHLQLKRFELRYVPESFIATLITEAFLGKNEYLERLNEDPMAFDLGMSYDDKQSELIDEDALEAEISRSSLINLFEAALVDAVHQGASDLHIFPNADRQIEIHFRIDGELKRWHMEERIHPEAFLAVVKDNSVNVDRFDREVAQDGFIQRWVDGALIRFRVSVLPIASAAQELRAESIVIRVLDDRKVLTDLRKLGMLDVAMKRFDAAIREPNGMVILTGPTGSGKSTTLVAALHQVVSPKVNVLTVEDPVEYIIRGVRQIKLGTRLNLEGALRAILRHDPDVVMVGEMRDRATAELAIKLANTGHLTFSTLHTNDAPSAVSRLYKMGVEPFLIAYAINLVVAQRLIRKLCTECKEVDTDLDRELLRYLGFTEEEMSTLTFYKAGNNSHCKTCKGSGYKGRRAVAETMLFSKEIRAMIMAAEDQIDEDGLREQAVKEGMLTLKDSAREVVKMGDTSVEEMLRVVGGAL